ncbi:hypothetical protein OFB92_31980, partial [Escherichia coli]|nr:hypothetical protein [Escherichia coli]
ASRLEGELAAFGLPVLGISALSGENLEALTDTLFALVQAAPKPALETPQPRPPADNRIRVEEVEEGVFEVSAPQLERQLARMKGEVSE